MSKSSIPKSPEEPFDPKDFLAKVDGGRTISKYRKNQRFSRKGTPQILFFTSRRARSRSRSFPNTARKLSSQFSGVTNFAVKDAYPGNRSAWRPRRR